MRMGWIGLGTMGAPMAKNVLAAGHALTVYNRTPEKMRPLAALGAATALAPAAVAAASDAVAIMVTGPAELREVVLGAGGVITGAAKGTLVVDFSTVGPEAAAEIAAACASAGLRFLSSPVTGSRPAAEKAALTLLVGGPAPVREAAQPLLTSVGARQVAVSTAAAAQALKLCMNQTFALAVHALVEGASLAEKSGVGVTSYLEGVQASLMANELYAIKGAALLEDDFNQIFMLGHMAKDLELGGELARKSGAYLPVAASLRELYRGALAAGLGSKDYLATALFLHSTERE
jgi:3-hydroxyisobutyrate dehydrogenase-like beta-hydroxyacid dehydrogenase